MPVYAVMFAAQLWLSLPFSAGAAETGCPEVTLPTAEWDFGTVKEGSTFTHTFQVESTGSSALRIERVRASCKCFEVSIDAQELDPGTEATLEVVTDTKGRRGKFKKYIYIESNDLENPRARIKITGFIERAKGSGRAGSSPRIELDVVKPARGDQPVCVTYFHSSTCEECRATRKALAELTQANPTVAVRLFDIDELESYALMLKMEKAHGRIEYAPPIIYVGTTLLDGWDEVKAKLATTVRTRPENGKAAEWPPEVASVGQDGSLGLELVREKFNAISTLAIVGAGLVDGINPCAFATLVFFVSLLARFGKSRRETIVVGLCFTLAVFVTYLLLGVGLLKVIQAFSVSVGVARGITYAIAALAVVFGGYSVYDYLVWRRTRSGAKMKLKLPRVIQQRIHSVMKAGLTARSLAIAALVTGVPVSVLESICTGQVYLPAIAYVLRDPRSAFTR